ncbi:MAG: family 43 glycosylhydrolase [Micromonosporaceae bacterium]
MSSRSRRHLSADSEGRAAAARQRRRWLSFAVSATAAATVGLLAPGIAQAQMSDPGSGSAPEVSAVGPMPLADPDTIEKPGPDLRYISYGTSRAGHEIPYVIHGSGNTVSMDDTIDGDAMPGGPGAWARDDIGLWAPSVVNHKGSFYLFYSATLKDTGDPGRKCIGVATSGAATGPFHPRDNPLLCNEGGWSIDPDAFVGAFNGNLYVTYRDDKVVPRPETAISAALLDDAATRVIEKRVIFKSTDVAWETVGIGAGDAHVIENPTMIRQGGHWWLFYSGNRWQTARYSTGAARCGDSPTAIACSPQPGQNRPWFGYLGADGLQDTYRPMKGLPGNHPGPGGMSVFTARDGTLRAVWHYLDGSSRSSITGKLAYNSADWAVTTE